MLLASFQSSTIRLTDSAHRGAGQNQIITNVVYQLQHLAGGHTGWLEKAQHFGARLLAGMPEAILVGKE